MRIFAIPIREHSSVGLEHLPYKQRVGGSTPSAPTRRSLKNGLFFCVCFSLSHDTSWYPIPIGIDFAFTCIVSIFA